MRLLPPLRFRHHEDDQARYGGDWYVYDEAALTRIPARELVDIEAAIGMSVRTMLQRARQNYTDATLAAAWLSRRLAGVRENFEDYQPMVLLMDWEIAPSATDADPPEETPSTSPPTE